MSEIKIGSNVICVDDTRWSNEKGVLLIYKNTYKVLDITECKKCKKVFYDIGCKRMNLDSHHECCGKQLVGSGIDWVGEYRLKPYFTNFKEFTKKEVISKIYEDIETLVKDKKYEKAIETIKRLEKINDEL
jgi:hypothetical protein